MKWLSASMSQRSVVHLVGAGALALSSCATGPRSAAPAAACATVPGGPSATSAALAPPGERLLWLGGPTALLERDGFRLLTDPMLGARSKRAFVLPRHPSTGAPMAAIARYTDPPSVELSALDAVLLSHGHADHFDDTARARLAKDGLVIAPPHIRSDLEAAGFRNIKTLDWGEQLTLRGARASLTITAVPAHHAHEPAVDAQSLKVNGYILTWERASGSPQPTRYTIYWTGDSVTFEGQAAAVAPFAPIDLLLPHLGGVGGDGPALKTMDADELDSLVAAVNPQQVIPIHHTTFGHYREPIAAVEQHALRAGWSSRLRVLPEGGSAPLGGGERR